MTTPYPRAQSANKPSSRHRALGSPDLNFRFDDALAPRNVTTKLVNVSRGDPDASFFKSSRLRSKFGKPFDVMYMPAKP